MNNIAELDKKMEISVSHFEKELQSIRTSRANPSMLDNISADAYGNKTPIKDSLSCT